MNHLLSKIDITRGGKLKFENIISKVKGNIYIVSVDSDLFFTDFQNRETFYKACVIKDNMFFKTIKSDHGHDAFLIEFDQVRELLSEIFTRKHTSILSN
jgi:homoserine acetyltransferase